MMEKSKKKIILYEDINFEEMGVPQAKDRRKNRDEIETITLIYDRRIGRLEFSRGVTMNLGRPEDIQVGFQDKKLFIGVERFLQGDFYTVKYGDSKLKKKKNLRARGNVYNKALIEEIIETYDLEFGEKTSIVFDKIKYIEKDGEVKGILVRMKQPK